MSETNEIVEPRSAPVRKAKPKRRSVSVGDSTSPTEVLLRIESALLRIGEMVATSGRDQDSQIAALRTLGCDWPRIGELVGIKADGARMKFSRSRSSGGDTNA